MASIVYILCGLTSFACALLLLRGYRRFRTRLLLWSTVCFLALAVNNTLLFVDLVITGPTVDLSLLRIAVSITGIGFLLYGLIWDMEPER